MGKLSLSLHYLFEKALLSLPFYRYIAVSKYTEESLTSAGIDPQKILLIHNGIDYGEYGSNEIDFSPVPKNDVFTFIYFGRLGISKGLDLILGATQLLKDNHAKFHLKLIIPTVPKKFYDHIKNEINKRQILDVISIESNLPWSDLRAKVNGSDAVIIPSYSEGFCFTAVESMAMNRPIISSGKGALNEVVTGKHILMSTHDENGLYDAMKKGLVGDWTETTLIKYPLESSVNKYLSLYNNIKT